MSIVQTLTQSSPNFETLLSKSHILSRQVFEPETPEDRYTTTPSRFYQLQLDTWRARLDDPAAAILYVADPVGDMMQAFFLAHPRPLVIGSDQIVYYIWLAAVHPSARGQGLFPLLLEAAKARARENGYDVLSIGTVPSVFTRMYSILSRQGSGWEVVEWKPEDDGTPKVVMKMNL